MANNISDIIEAFLIETLGGEDRLDISRNELANFFSVVPSQINYVLSTRFTPERGYVIESRRGGGGFITVLRLNNSPQQIYDEFFSRASSQGLTFVRASQIIDRMVYDNLVTDREGELIRTAISDKSLIAPSVVKDGLRLNILRQIFLKVMQK